MPNEPKPLKYVWVRWRYNPKCRLTKWHKVWLDSRILDNMTWCNLFWGGTSDFEVTADTPPPDQCCKRCTERMER